MNQVVSTLLVLVILFPIPPMPAQASGNRSVTLQERLADMAGEGARFLDNMPDSERARLHDAVAQEQGESVDAERLRVRLLLVGSGNDISLQLRDGQRVEGKLSDINDEEFSLMVPNPVWRRGPKVKSSFLYEEVLSTDSAEPPVGKKIEVVLRDREKVRGHLEAFTEHALVLNVDRGVKREVAYEDVSELRRLGKSAATIIAIGTGVFFALGGIVAFSARED